MESNAVDYKCPSCGATIPFSPEKQKWVCSYCGSEFTLEELQKAQKQSVVEESKEVQVEDADIYRCQSCGAEIIADENTTATFCVYCGNTAILKDKIHNSRVPDLIIPFQKVKEDATKAFEKVVKHKPLVPKAFKTKDNIQKITGVYIPFWAYDFQVSGTVKFHATDVHTWTDFRNEYIKTEGYSVVCEGNMDYDKVLADGSSRFPDDLMDSLEPFDFQGLVSYNQAFLAGFFAEKYDVDEDKAVERAQKRAVNTSVSLMRENVNHQSCALLDNQLNVQKQKVYYILLPVWMVNTKYRDKIYTFAMNGQTGKIVGDLPLGRKEVVVWSLVIYLICFVICLLLFLGGVI